MAQKKRGRPTKQELAQRQAKKERELKKQRRRSYSAIALSAAGLFFTVLAFLNEEAVAWNFMRRALFGILGWLSYVLGPVLILLGIIVATKRSMDKADAVSWGILALAVSSATYVFNFARPSAKGFWNIVKELYIMGADRIGTGLISAVLGYPMDIYLGKAGGKVTSVILICAALLLVTGKTPVDAAKLIWKPFAALFVWIKKKVEEYKEKKQLEYENSISLETLRSSETFEEKAKRIDVPLDGERRDSSGKKKNYDIPLDDALVFAPKKEKKKVERAEKHPSIDVDLGPDFDPTVEGVALNPTGPAGSVVKDVLEKNASSSELFASFDGSDAGRSLDEIRQSNAYFEDKKQQMDAAAKLNAASDTHVNPVVDEEVAALARKADTEYLKNTNATAVSPTQTRAEARVYKLPPVNLLNKQVNKDDKSLEAELSQNAELLVSTLESFGVHARMIDISRGPTVTRYELQPETGVRLNRITQLADDIALNMAAVSVRIEAPIPGKAAVGIEIPNKTVQTVNLRPVIESEEFQKSKGALPFALGKDVTGAVKVGTIENMPHLLIAGATGMGKSVCINSILMSLLYKCSPDELKLILVDPKMVEFTSYEGLPHLYLPVVTDPRKAAGALGWAVSEMLKRYRKFSTTRCRNITEYNKYVSNLLSNPDYEPEDGEEMPSVLPRVVIVIDELADLMMAAPNEVEDAIARLAQMARAAGMHLILATQRPSVDVITGVIKNNIPSRIAFAVSSQVDSRTILDGAGAEKLLGRGDMLYMPVGSTKSTRIQGCFVTDEEVEKVVKYIKDRYSSEYDEEIMKEIERNTPVQKNKGGIAASEGDSDASDIDDMYKNAVEAVLEAGAASTSMLQRRLRLGYARAARIMDQMEEEGIISAQDGSKPRQVLISKQMWLEKLTKGE